MFQTNTKRLLERRDSFVTTTNGKKRVIGSGQYASVIEGQDKDTGEIFALKQVRVSSQKFDGGTSFRTFFREVAALKGLSECENVVKLYDYHVGRAGDSVLVLEKCDFSLALLISSSFRVLSNFAVLALSASDLIRTFILP